MMPQPACRLLGRGVCHTEMTMQTLAIAAAAILAMAAQLVVPVQCSTGLARTP